MVFSDSTFLFVFFPIVLIIYYALKLLTNRIVLRNIFLFGVSVIFYAWGNIQFLSILLLSIMVNYISGIMIDIFKKSSLKKIGLIISLIINLGILFHYKYQFFVFNTVKQVFNTNWRLQEIVLPIGISFFTFQALSYVVDVYRGSVKVQKNLIDLGLYISFFPQLVAGPIVRYDTIEKQIGSRQERIDLFSKGVLRFVVGLGKKVLLANNLAIAADYVFEGMQNEMAILTYWIGAISYTFQILFDFSGYSDMAIGLGLMFGFEFEENFNYPYVASSITDFWRRWHISLSTWFRDYVYIPRGGNRCSAKRHISNMFLVWLLTGVWHGANWTFILWGMLYFSMLVIEKYFIHPDEMKKKMYKGIYRIFTLCIIILAWVLFRSDSIGQALAYVGSMFGIKAKGLFDASTRVLLHEFGLFFILATVASFPATKVIESYARDNKAWWFCKALGYTFILLISLVYIINGAYNPFIYFNF